MDESTSGPGPQQKGFSHGADFGRIYLKIDITDCPMQIYTRMVEDLKAMNLQHSIGGEDKVQQKKSHYVELGKRNYKYLKNSRRVPSGYMTTKQVARALKVSTSQVGIYLRQGVIKDAMGGGMGRPWFIPSTEVQRASALNLNGVVVKNGVEA